MAITRMCKACGNVIEIGLFSRNNQRKDGLHIWCKKCVSEYDKNRYDKNKHKTKERKTYSQTLTEKYCYQCDLTKLSNQFSKNKRAKGGLNYICKNCVKLNRKTYPRPTNSNKTCIHCNKNTNNFSKNKYSKDGYKSICKNCEYNQKQLNKNHYAKYRQNYKKQRRQIDINFRLREIVSSNIYRMLKKAKNNESIIKHLPYTIGELKNHIESKFEPWMSWDNYGKYDSNKNTWQIDHIIPQSKLPFTSFEDDNFKILWALDNLRPLETIANIKKGNKIGY